MRDTAWPKPAWGFDSPLAVTLFWQLASEAKHPRTRSDSWSTDVSTLDGLDGVVLRMDDRDGQCAVTVTDELIVWVRLDDGHVRVNIAAADADALSAAHRLLVELFPRSQPSDGLVPVTFWTYSPHGPRAVTRKISVAPWDAIDGNYAPATRGVLAGMMRAFRPSHGGQLVLWQGPPGTGKTHALRALAWEWRAWATLNYIVDPDELFGSHADYLIEVLLHEGEQVLRSSDGLDGEEEQPEMWRVLVLEDTGELLAADAKERTGQALSRLLNTVDGMIGQGLRVLVLVTTNEDLKRLHPAVQRPGRCALQVSFGELSLEDARAMLDDRGGDPELAQRGMSLAELYALLDGYAEQPAERLVGFAG
jgi:hypothetical protein